MKKILTILIIFLITIFGANYIIGNYMDKIQNKKNLEEKIKKEKEEKKRVKIKNEKIAKINVENKINALRKRFELK